MDLKAVGDVQSMTGNEVVCAYQWLIDCTARKFVKGGVDLDDLKQEAAIALLEAKDKWSPESGATFQGYAARRMSWRMRRVLRAARSRRAFYLEDPLDGSVFYEARESASKSVVGRESNAHYVRPLIDLIGIPATQESDLGDAEQRAVIREAIDKLPAAEREMLERWAKSSHRSLANELGTSRANSHRRCKVLLAKLQRLLHRRVQLGAPKAA